MSEHRISPATITRYRRAVIRRDVLIMVFAFLSIFTVALSQGASIIILLFIIVMLTLVTASRVARTARTIDQDLGDYAIALDDDRLTRIPSLTLTREEVTAIEERRGGGLAVWGPERKTMIPVPEMVEGYAEVRRRLGEWKPIERKDR
jgi:Ca2+/Na+ antiporter